MSKESNFEEMVDVIEDCVNDISNENKSEVTKQFEGNCDQCETYKSSSDCSSSSGVGSITADLQVAVSFTPSYDLINIAPTYETTTMVLCPNKPCAITTEYVEEVNVPSNDCSSSLDMLSFTLFQTTVLDLDYFNSKVEAVFFTVWDNIMGPRIKHVWWLTQNASNFVTNDILRNASSYILSSEAGRDPNSNHIIVKLFVKKEEFVILSSFTFSALVSSDQQMAICAFVYVLNYKQLSWFMPRANLFQSWTMRFLFAFRILVMNVSKNMGEFLECFDIFS